MPVSSVSGMKIVDDDRQHLHHFVQPVADVRQVRIEHAGDPVLEDQHIVGNADEMVVYVAETERHLRADVDEIAARQPGDRRRAAA